MDLVSEAEHPPRRLKCLLCKSRIDTMAILCDDCRGIAELAAPTFIALDPTEHISRRVKSEFLKNWLHPTTTPKIVGIFQIWMPRSSTDAYEDVRGRNHSQAELWLYLSSKAADYEQLRNGRHGKIRNVLIARVATGREEVLKRDDPSKQKPGEGYDCVHAPGGRPGLNYSEYAAYNDFGALPVFVISFEGGYPSTE
ncbi:hypothetical protein CF326_g1996 [Tilletia indica]|nr:hypothetical protein CF326_g1996 [Tilletia indica]